MKTPSAASKALLVLCTAPDKKSAETLARALLTERLCACVNMVNGVSSLFHWEGKIDSSEECMLLIKTRKELYKDVERSIKSKHPYSVPEIISCVLENVQPDYLAWLFQETRR